MQRDELAHGRAISDLYLISALIAYGLQPQRIDRTNLRRQKFIFDDDKPINVFVACDGEHSWKQLTVSEVETYFISSNLYLPGDYPKVLQDVRANIHGYREDHSYEGN